jgi:cell wall assembly regulator SMI1
MTSNDRHASHDSPYRTGNHMPVNQNRHAPLTSVATAADSQPDLADHGDAKRPSISATSVGLPSPARPYSPGMRSMSSPKVPQTEETPISPGEIQMQSFADGAPPPPPPSHSWKKIDRWAEKNYEELFDNLCEGCTQNDINELEHVLDITLPQDVRESLSIHDGQERGGRPTGIILGCMLLDCEEIVQEWNNWKVVNEEYLSKANKPAPHYPLKSLNNAGSSSSSSSAPQNKTFWRQELLERQDSQPPKAIQKAYAHPSWIPLARDWGGNNIAVDLAPGPLGKWGQIILFGRDYDCKYVIARSWSHFLAVVADDISSDRVMVDEDTGEMKLKEFKTENIEPPYMEILRWRADQKYGRKQINNRNSRAYGLNTNVKPVNGKGSPYSSPIAETDEQAARGRGPSPQRFSRTNTGSPRPSNAMVGSPLARVQEEIAQPQPLSIKTGGDVVKDFARDIEGTNTSQGDYFPSSTHMNGSASQGRKSKPQKLVDAPTPIDTSMRVYIPNSRNGSYSEGPTETKKEKLVDIPTPTTARSDAGGRRDFPATSLSRVSTLNDLSEDKENQTRQKKVQEAEPAGKVNEKATDTKENGVKGLGVDTLKGEMRDVAI